jgi:hypothetical protein
MTRREWLAMVAATPLVKVTAESTAIASPAPAAPVAIAKAASYDDDIIARLKTSFRRCTCATRGRLSHRQAIVGSEGGVIVMANLKIHRNRRQTPPLARYLAASLRAEESLYPGRATCPL